MIAESGHEADVYSTPRILSFVLHDPSKAYRLRTSKFQSTLRCSSAVKWYMMSDFTQTRESAYISKGRNRLVDSDRHLSAYRPDAPTGDLSRTLFPKENF